MKKCSDCQFAYVKLNKGYLQNTKRDLEHNEKVYGDSYHPFTSLALVESVRCGYNVWSPLSTMGLIPIVDNIANQCVYFRRFEDDD